MAAFYLSTFLIYPDAIAKAFPAEYQWPTGTGQLWGGYLGTRGYLDPGYPLVPGYPIAYPEERGVAAHHPLNRAPWAAFRISLRDGRGVASTQFWELSLLPSIEVDACLLLLLDFWTAVAHLEGT